MKLSNTRITATHTIGMNIWGEHSFQVSFPKEITFEGDFKNLPNTISNAVIVNVNGSYVKARVNGDKIRLGSKATKGMCVSNYEGEDLILEVLNCNGKVIHKQPLNKVAKVKDVGNFKG